VLEYLKTKMENAMENKVKKVRCELDMESYKKIGHFCVEHDLFINDLIKIALLEYIENHTK
jgi:hypothetical protein